VLFRLIRVFRVKGLAVGFAGGFAVAALAPATGVLEAQVAPNENWRTIRTEHFYVHFTPELEEVARRAAMNAESAYTRLARHLTPPRGIVDLVVTDNVDLANGSASAFPSNRIVIYASPPVFQSALRFTDDPIDLVVTHELVHIFHLDRVGGIWKVLQSAFGRVPFFFPNVYQPSWLIEGLAVYYESLITGSGRIEGSEHRMIARSAALAHTFPRLDQVSLARPQFPYGTSAYAYGSLFMDHLARTHGDSAMRVFVESMSRQIIPLYLTPPARKAFGSSFTRQYRLWSDSLLRAAPPEAPPTPGWRDLTREGAFANLPRWLNDSTLVYTGTPGDESYGAYRLTLRTPDFARASPHVTRERIGRRNSRSPNSVLADGSLLYSQLEYSGPYHLRSDLYVDRRRGGTRRLTHASRLAFPDARADGLIAAVQTLPAGTRLALVSPDGRSVTPITSGGPDEHWTEPRWSPDGKHIAASRWTRGGASEIVVIDTTGAVTQTLIRERAVSATPSWSRDGRHVYFSSDRTGIPNLYRAAFRRDAADTTSLPPIQRVSDAQTGLFEPQPSPSDADLAAVVFKADGYHIGVAPVDAQRPTTNAERLTHVAPRDASPIVRSDAPSTRYSPWRSLRPTWVLPYVEAGLGDGTRIGGYTSGEDVVGRHAYEASLAIPTDNSGITGTLYYRDARLGQPLLELFAEQSWENLFRILDAAQQNRPIGMLRRRIREAGLSFTFLRPRARTNSFLSLGSAIEARDYAVDSLPLLDRIDSLYRRAFYYPRLSLSVGWSNPQYPPLAISPEDGIAVAATTRFRWRTGDAQSRTVSLVGNATVYKSLDLPGYAHHVVALHAAGGAQDNRGTGYFEVGGVSSGTVDVAPGYVLGEGRRTFGVRGFPAASLLGIHAFAGNVEYRAPLLLPGRGLGTLPLFLDRVSLSVFGDVGAAWCPGTFLTRPAPSASLCTRSDIDNGFALLTPQAIASAGAEFTASAAILTWDHPFRWRAGVAVPVLGRELVIGEKPVSGYFTVGLPF
jgi:hypothetical protein